MLRTQVQRIVTEPDSQGDGICRCSRERSRYLQAQRVRKRARMAMDVVFQADTVSRADGERRFPTHWMKTGIAKGNN